MVTKFQKLRMLKSSYRNMLRRQHKVLTIHNSLKPWYYGEQFEKYKKTWSEYCFLRDELCKIKNEYYYTANSYKLIYF